mgnify:CR=1 FL=1
MERELTYTDGESTINVGDLFDIDGTKLMIKEIFTLNEEKYVSYDMENQLELIIELVSKFINDKKEYFNTVISHPFNEDGCCTCGEEH